MMDPSHCPIAGSAVNRAISMKSFVCANSNAAPELASDWLDFLVVGSFFFGKLKKLKSLSHQKPVNLSTQIIIIHRACPENRLVRP